MTLVVWLALGLGAAAVIDPRWGEWAGLAVIFFAGIPHGAFDLLAARQALGARTWPLGAVAAAYVGLGAAMSLLCFAVPLVGLVLFLVISFVHFAAGESLVIGRRQGMVTALAAIVVPIGLHAAQAEPYLAFFAAPDAVAAARPFIAAAAWLCVGLTAAVVSIRIRAGDAAQAGELLICLSAWCLFPPLAGFAVWFVGRHSRHHLARCCEIFIVRPRLLSADAVLISVAACALILPLGLWFDFSKLEEIFAAAIILIAGLTLPHMAVTYALERSIQNRR